MGERKFTEIFCDRCKAILDKKPYYGEAGTYRIKAISDFAVAGGVDFDWKDLCKDCNRYVGKLIERIKAETREAEANE